MNKSITGFNCYSISEVKKRNFNYFLNSDNQFEKCDISCYECENENNLCKSCNINYYEIFGHKNRTCFHYPLELYGLIKFEGDILFKRCFKLCKYCSQVTESLFFQQCTDCIDNYTLDLFSFQQSLCIPKDNSNSYFIKKKTKWYIPNFEGIERLEISNNTKIDYELLLNNLEYSNIGYMIAEGCPPDKPYIIYSIRQCVSSCNSTNLVEFGLFMIKKLYLYNDICYDKCPYGSEEDDNELICKEINHHTTVNDSISINEYIENNNINIMHYLSEYSNNSVGITRIDDFSNYFYNQSINDSYKLKLEMPIFNFTECIEKLRINFNLDNETNIFIGIMEYNSQKAGKENIYSNLVNRTAYQFFINNGTILEYSICLC